MSLVLYSNVDVSLDALRNELMNSFHLNGAYCVPYVFTQGGMKWIR